MSANGSQNLLSVTDNIEMDLYPCPCCGKLTLDEEPPGTWLICEVCWWEDDPVQFADPGYRGGANRVSLNEARSYFRAIGTSSPEHRDQLRHDDPWRLPGGLLNDELDLLRRHDKMLANKRQSTDGD